MPVHRVKGGFKWGKHGHVYKTRAGAERQAAAIYANGYRGDAKAGPAQEFVVAPEQLIGIYEFDGSPT